MGTKILLYCTKVKSFLLKIKGEYVIDSKELWEKYNYNPNDIDEILNGKIVAECEMSVEEIFFMAFATAYIDERYYRTESLPSNKLLEKSCLTFNQLDNYLEGSKGYALHISNLNIFDESKRLYEYGVKKAPQNMCRTYKDNQEYVLISIQPKWLRKILNGEKTIEIRKKVLNCMKE